MSTADTTMHRRDITLLPPRLYLIPFCLINLYSQPGLQRMVLRLEDLIRRIDLDLHKRFETEGIQYMQFSFRWWVPQPSALETHWITDLTLDALINVVFYLHTLANHCHHYQYDIFSLLLILSYPTLFYLQDELPLTERAASQSNTQTLGYVPIWRDRRIWKLSRICLCSTAENIKREIDGYGERILSSQPLHVPRYSACFALRSICYCIRILKMTIRYLSP